MFNDQDESGNPSTQQPKQSTKLELVPQEDEAFLRPINWHSDVNLVYKSEWVEQKWTDYLNLEFPPQILGKTVLKRLAELEFANYLDVESLALTVKHGLPFTTRERNVLVHFGLYEYFVPRDPIMLYMKISETVLETTVKMPSFEEALVWLQDNAFWKLRYFEGIKVQVCAEKSDRYEAHVAYRGDCPLSKNDQLEFKDIALDALQEALNSCAEKTERKAHVLEHDRIGFKRALEVFRAQAKS